MLSSLFGDLRPHLDDASRRDPLLSGDREHGFAATAILDSVATQVNDQGHMVDRHTRDLVVSGSPAQAMRDHLSATRADLDRATKVITMFDPTGVWAAGVIKALSDASGRPVERLQLREHATLRTLALIERTTLERRHEEPLRIYHADVRAPGLLNADIPFALMEHSNMTVVIVGAMSPHAVDDMLSALQYAVNQPAWRCPTLLLMLPPGAVWIANKIHMLRWPARLRVQAVNESLTSASAVWNSMLSTWNRVKSEPPWPPAAVEEDFGVEHAIKVADLDDDAPPRLKPRGPTVGLASPPSSSPANSAQPSTSRPPPTTPASPPATTPPAPAPTLDPTQAATALALMNTVEGVLACAVVDGGSGLVLARLGGASEATALELVAAASAQVLRAHRAAARDMGLTEPIDEVITSAGHRHHVLRGLSKHRELFLFALLDKHRCNLALARYKLMEAEQRLC